MNPEEETNLKRTLYLVLCRIQSSYYADPVRFKLANAGLCWIVGDELRMDGDHNKQPAARAMLCEMWTRWPMYSGCSEYPVPAFNERNGYRYKTTKHVARAFYLTKKWDITTRYGAARVALLDWLVKELGQELAP